MAKLSMKLGLAAATLAAFAGAVAVPATASAAKPAPLYDLVLIVGEGETATETTLTCSPSGGTHADPQGACHDLLSVNGDWEQLKLINDNPGTMCPMVYEPVKVAVVGTYAGVGRIAYQGEVGNACQFATSYGRVF
ncbi:SSI family serine proteinase inhibitor [Longispora albida]|uniref:SSI family serine proteinase inhibitor n=1 Tax=Longispora albida TaxID=203523 RepID=UPI00036ED543|nr:SSI family serine proteinase inhibitor [Longispora albida]